MKVFIGGYRSGKTTQLLKLAKENKGIYIASTMKLAREAGKHYNLEDWQMSSHICLLEGRLRNNKHPIYIDDLEMLITGLASYNQIAAGSLWIGGGEESFCVEAYKTSYHPKKLWTKRRLDDGETKKD